MSNINQSSMDHEKLINDVLYKENYTLIQKIYSQNWLIGLQRTEKAWLSISNIYESDSTWFT